MTTRPTVWVAHEPLRRDRVTGEMYPAHDLTPASEWGDIRIVLPSSNRPPVDPEAVLPALRDAMDNYRPGDHIVLVGDMDLVVWMSVLAARRTRGAISLLRWDGRLGRYVAKSAQVYDEELCEIDLNV
jgi:hypothetical protein